MESPETSRQKLRENETLFSKIHSTPTSQRISSEEFSLYYLHKESSPNFRAGQDVLEVGWGDSPEPINIQKKSALNKTSINCKKKLEPKESPRSSMSSKRRNMRSTLRIPSNSLVDIAKYVAEVQELSKNIMKELDANKNEKELSDAKNHLTNNQLDQSDNMSQSHLLLQKPILDSETKDTLDLYTENCSVENKDSSFDNVLQSFINEEDEWLSQAISSQEAIKPVPKISFVKCKSENELLLGQPKGTDVKNKFANKIKNNFQRTSSFDIKRSITNLNNNALTKISSSQIKSSTGTKEVVSKAPTVQYSQQEIEKKRLEAIYRRERKEIERKKMEALKRLEMKKMRAIKT